MDGLSERRHGKPDHVSTLPAVSRKHSNETVGLPFSPRPKPVTERLYTPNGAKRKRMRPIFAALAGLETFAGGLIFDSPFQS